MMSLKVMSAYCSSLYTYTFSSSPNIPKTYKNKLESESINLDFGQSRSDSPTYHFDVFFAEFIILLLHARFYRSLARTLSLVRLEVKRSLCVQTAKVCWWHLISLYIQS